jgi:hypothetical protein
MRKLFILAAVIFAGYLYFGGQQGTNPDSQRVSVPDSVTATADSVFADAYANRRSNIQVSGEGTVTRLLPDDNKGSRHQKFIVRLASGQTLMVAHNIDAAPRVAGLRAGDRVKFSGEYEWNDKGGVIHWTHRTSSGPHPGGWLRHGGQTHQ